MDVMQSQTIQLTLPKADLQMLRRLASAMGWTLSALTAKKRVE